MADRDVIGEDRIQDYIDDRLSEQDRASVAAYLLAHPEVGAEVEQLRLQHEALKAIGREILEEPVPERLRQALYPPAAHPPADVIPMVPAHAAAAPRRSHFLEAAAAVLLFVVGALVGWQGNDILRPAVTEDELAIAGVAQAFTEFNADRSFPIEFPPDRNLELASWIKKSFQADIEAPSLTSFDYDYIGGRLLPGARGKIGSFLFENPAGKRVAVFFWPRQAPPKKVVELSRRDGVETRFWFGDDFGFAVVGNINGDAGIDRLAEAVFEHYENRVQR